MSEYCHGLDEKRIVYRLRCARGDLERVTLSYGDTACRVTPIIFTTLEMELAASDEYHDYWQVSWRANTTASTTILRSTAGRRVDVLLRRRASRIAGGRPLGVLQAALSTTARTSPASRTGRATRWSTTSSPTASPPAEGSISGYGAELDLRRARRPAGRLGGTLDGVAANAEYIRCMGFNCVYLNPIFAAGEYHKYDTLDYMHVDPCFGGDEAFRRMVDALHARGCALSSTACSTTAAGASGPLRT